MSAPAQTLTEAETEAVLDAEPWGLVCPTCKAKVYVACSGPESEDGHRTRWALAAANALAEFRSASPSIEADDISQAIFDQADLGWSDASRAGIAAHTYLQQTGHLT